MVKSFWVEVGRHVVGNENLEELVLIGRLGNNSAAIPPSNICYLVCEGIAADANGKGAVDSLRPLEHELNCLVRTW